MLSPTQCQEQPGGQHWNLWGAILPSTLLDPAMASHRITCPWAQRSNVSSRGSGVTCLSDEQEETMNVWARWAFHLGL